MASSFRPICGACLRIFHCGLDVFFKPIAWRWFFLLARGLRRLVESKCGRGEIAYSVQALGTLGGRRSDPRGINSSGQVAGSAEVAEDVGHATLYSGGVQHDLGTLGGAWSGANGLNAAGKVVGNYVASSGATRAFIYSGGVMSDLGLPAGGDTQANDINDSGVVVGSRTVAGAGDRAFRLSGSVLTTFNTLGGANSSARAINASGKIVGTADVPGIELRFHAAAFTDSGVVNLGTLGGSLSSAADINDNGLIVGDSDLPGNSSVHAFLYDATGMHDLGTLPGYVNSAALGINNMGHIVGAASKNTGSAAILYRDGAMLNLNAMIDPESKWDLRAAVSINDAGQIVGFGMFDSSSYATAFLLTPVPEPATPMLALFALTGLLLKRRRIRGSR